MWRGSCTGRRWCAAHRRTCSPSAAGRGRGAARGGSRGFVRPSCRAQKLCCRRLDPPRWQPLHRGLSPVVQFSLSSQSPAAEAVRASSRHTPCPSSAQCEPGEAELASPASDLECDELHGHGAQRRVNVRDGWAANSVGRLGCGRRDVLRQSHMRRQRSPLCSPSVGDGATEKRIRRNLANLPSLDLSVSGLFCTEARNSDPNEGLTTERHKRPNRETRLNIFVGGRNEGGASVNERMRKQQHRACIQGCACEDWNLDADGLTRHYMLCPPQM